MRINEGTCGYPRFVDGMCEGRRQEGQWECGIGSSSALQWGAHAMQIAGRSGRAGGRTSTPLVILLTASSTLSARTTTTERRTDTRAERPERAIGRLPPRDDSPRGETATFMAGIVEENLDSWVYL